MKCPMCQAESEFGVTLCQCGYNFFTGEKMDRAPAPRGEGEIAPAPDLSKVVNDDGTWACPCGVTNKKENERCRGCGYSLRQTKIMMESRLGADDPRLKATWKCRCGKENVMEAANCTVCRTPQAEIMEAAIVKIDMARKQGLDWDRIIKYSVILVIWGFVAAAAMAFVNLGPPRSGSYLNRPLATPGSLVKLAVPVAIVNYLVFVYIFACLAKGQSRKTYEHAMLVVVVVKLFDLATELLLGRNFVGRLGTWIVASIVLCSAAVVGVWAARMFRREREA